MFPPASSSPASSISGSASRPSSPRSGAPTQLGTGPIDWHQDDASTHRVGSDHGGVPQQPHPASPRPPKVATPSYSEDDGFAWKALGGMALCGAGVVGLIAAQRRAPGLPLAAGGFLVGGLLALHGPDAGGINPVPASYVVAGAALLGGLLLVTGASAATALSAFTVASLAMLLVGCENPQVNLAVRAVFTGCCLVRMRHAALGSPAIAASWLARVTTSAGCVAAWLAAAMGAMLAWQAVADLDTD